ncbi:MAG: hypothetical protein PHD82_16645 [Candidatus Riflebacteria bacterium]|nr:hypothetical protein [Candidatus Riflebacteria bacterium]
MRIFFCILTILLFTLQLHTGLACTMEPSVWKQIEAVDKAEETVIYALTDSLLQFKDKFEREMKACNMASGPLTFTAVFVGSEPATIDTDFHDSLRIAINVIWPDAILLMPASMPASLDDYVAIASLAESLPEGYAVSLHFKKTGSSIINLADHNFKLYQLYRLVIREEASMFARVTDRHAAAVFLDEFMVSPTIIADALISPLGGFIIRLEKNSARPLVVDFGPVSDGGEHVLRFNDAFRQPTIVPPLPEDLPEPAACNHSHH